MFGHQTMFDGVWSPNFSRLDRALVVSAPYLIFLRTTVEKLNRCISVEEKKVKLNKSHFNVLVATWPVA